MQRIPKSLQQDRKAVIPAVETARDMICAIPMDTARGESRRHWLERVGDALNIGRSEASRLYYRQKKKIDADKFERMRAASSALQQQATNNEKAIGERRAEIAALRSGLGLARGSGVVSRPGGGSPRAGDTVEGTGRGETGGSEGAASPAAVGRR